MPVTRPALCCPLLADVLPVGVAGEKHWETCGDLAKPAHGRAHGGDTQPAVFRYDKNGRINFSIFELKRGSWKQRVIPLLNSAKIHQKDRQNEVYSWRKFETFKKIRKLSNKQDLIWFVLILFSWRLWDIYHLIIYAIMQSISSPKDEILYMYYA